MEKLNRYYKNISFILLIIVGIFLLWWGIRSIVSEPHVPSITVYWLDRSLTDINQYVWLPAVGVFLLTASISPVIAVMAQNNRVIRIVISVTAVGIIAVGGMLVIISLSRIWGIIYVSPVLLTGLLLLATAFDFHNLRKLVLSSV